MLFPAVLMNFSTSKVCLIGALSIELANLDLSIFPLCDIPLELFSLAERDSYFDKD